MVRPRKNRLVQVDPRAVYFKPRGIPLVDLEEAILTMDGLEALRLADLMGLSHEEAGARMGVSRATFGRIVQAARKTVADALVNGKAVLVEGGTFERPGIRPPCGRCGAALEGTRPADAKDCPACRRPGNGKLEE